MGKIEIFSTLLSDGKHLNLDPLFVHRCLLKAYNSVHMAIAQEYFNGVVITFKEKKSPGKISP